MFRLCGWLALGALVAMSAGPVWADSALPGRADPARVVPKGTLNSASGAPLAWHEPMDDNALHQFTALDRGEFGTGSGPDSYLWEAYGWAGGDINRFWWQTEGEGATAGGDPESIFIEASYGRSITPFWNALLGVRYDPFPDDDRVFGLVQLRGLAPGFLETEASLFVSEQGVPSTRGEIEYAALITQRLRLAPRAEINIGARDAAYGLGGGLQNTELGLRLKYQVVREFVPYVGLRYEQSYADTAQLLEREGESDSTTAFVIGFSAWY